ncbi:neuromedin-K receptor-like [Amphibalanus amphitrite]|uniref:neuromedin-K receptor-like n=1 Tax=Amphibalanus amphitrite TaxID=1232801 RepID=UPI001C918F7B|nr:neuromedin-K receptor-like [Amphibalanus amphitrite]
MFRMFVNGTVGNGSGDEPLDFSDLIDSRGEASRTGVVILAYSAIILVSLFGNLLVCQVVVRNKRLHTVTNTFITNLAVSDVLMTCLNIPFNISRVLLDDWPFGGFMCSVVPYVQVCAVYVSAFTMVAIALDRYQVIVKPLKPRLGPRQGAAIIAVIWLLAAVISLPHAVYNEVVTVFTFRALSRCQTRYPRPSRDFRKWLTLLTSLTQYYVPLTITGVAYSIITRKVWSRVVLGAATEEQMVYQARAKRKTIKMLMVVVVLFAICWMPLNLYHLIVDFSQSTSPTRHNSTLFFFCHWLAMSNVCYNPFIYCWLNEHFRAGALSWFKCLARRSSKVHPAIEINGILVQTSRRRGGDSTPNTMSSSLRADSVRRQAPGRQHEVTLNGYVEIRSRRVLASLLASGRVSTEPEPLAAAPDSPGEPRESGFPLLPRLCEQGKADAYDVICRNIEIVYRKKEGNGTVRGGRTEPIPSTDQFNVSIFAGGETPAAATGGADREPEDSDMVQPVSERVYRGQLTGLLRKQVLNGDGGGGSSGGRRLRETSFALGDPGRTRRSPSRRNSSTRSRRSV